MFSQNSHRSLTRRDSKLLVEVVIGIIGILGIMLAQVEARDSETYFSKLNNGGQIISGKVMQVAPQIDWLEVLF